MKQFSIKPNIHELDSFDALAKAFALGPDDLIFTQKIIYGRFIEPLKLNCQFLFQEDFGTGEPSDKMVDAILDSLKDRSYKRLVSVGGGTIIDIAKILVVDNITCTLDVFEDRIPFTRSRGLIQVPTTCGTGSEMTGVAVIDITSRHSKIGKRIESSFADDVVLIPELVKGLPYPFFLYSSVDALIHAMEIFACYKTSTYDDLFTLKAIRVILTGYKKIAAEGPDARFDQIGDFLKASNYAGIALANVLCGAVHAMAMHFGSAHHVAHGESNYRFLMSVFKLYARHSDHEKLQVMADIIHAVLGTEGGVPEAFAGLEALLRQLIPDKRLRDYGMNETDIEPYADRVLETQQRLLVNSHIPITREHLIGIYQELY